MSTKLALGLAAMISTCGGDAPPSAPSPAPDYTCDNAWDTGCRYQANVDIQSGTLLDASMFDTANGWGTAPSVPTRC